MKIQVTTEIHVSGGDQCKDRKGFCLYYDDVIDRKPYCTMFHYYIKDYKKCEPCAQACKGVEN